MALKTTAFVVVSGFVSIFTSIFITKKIEENPLTKYLDLWNNKITRKEISNHEPKPGEVDTVKSGTFTTITQDGKKKVLKIVDEITKKRSVLLLVEVATFGVVLSIFDILGE